MQSKPTKWEERFENDSSQTNEGKMILITQKLWN